jgi:hypothetical protein
MEQRARREFAMEWGRNDRIVHPAWVGCFARNGRDAVLLPEFVQFFEFFEQFFILIVIFLVKQFIEFEQLVEFIFE